MNGRYEIISEYFGLFEERSVICVTDSLTDAKFIVEALEKALEDRPFTFSHRKIAKEYVFLYDEEPDNILFCKVDYEENDK